MTSYFPLIHDAASDKKNYTIASTFEKAKSLKFELLFGEYEKKVTRENSRREIESVDYYFVPGQIFGYSCKSDGIDAQKFHHAFVLRACSPGEIGNALSAIVPGAEVLTRTLTSVSALRLIAVLAALRKGGVNLAQIAEVQYRRLNHLLEAKMNTDYFVGELIGETMDY